MALTDYQPAAPVPIVPVAAPTDDFSRQPLIPQAPQDTRFADLATGLSHLDSGLRDYMNQQALEERQNDLVKGAAAFYQGHAATFADAVASGAVPAQASPHFIAGFKRAQGAVAGYELQTAFSAAYDKWDGKDSQDPAAFSTFVQNFVGSHIGDSQDPAVLKGLMPHINELLNNGAARFQQDTNKTITQGALNASGALASQAVESGISQGLLTPTGEPDAPAVVARIIAERGKIPGQSLDAWDKTILDTVEAASVTARKPEIIAALLNTTIPGTDHTFGQTPHGALVTQHAAALFDRQARQQMADDASRSVAADKVAKGSAELAVIDSISKNPQAPLDESLLAQLNKYDAKGRIEALGWQKAMTAGEVASDPTAIMQVHQDILQGGGSDVITNALNNGIIKNPSDLDKAATLLHTVNAGGDPVALVLKSDAVKAAHMDLSGAFPIKGDIDNRLAALGGSTDAGRAAKLDLDMHMMQFVQANPTAGPIAVRQEVSKAMTEILKRAGPAEPMTERTYTPAGTVSGAVGETGTGPQPTDQPRAPKAVLAPATAPAASAPLPPPLSADGTAVAPHQMSPSLYWDGTKVQQGTLPTALPQPQESSAAPIGKNMTAPVQAILDAALKAPAENRQRLALQDITNMITQSRNPEPNSLPTRPFALAALNKEPQAAHILDLVGGHEAANNYNAVIGNTGSTQDLSKLTLNEVFSLQHQLVASGRESGAVGRYQFISSTLQNLVRDGGINPNTTLFTPQLQDQLALQLMKNRGYDQWKAGGLTDEQFAHNLSMEWASLPDPAAGGASHYQGVGSNRAGTTLGRFYRTLRGQ